MGVPMSAHFTNSRLEVNSRELITDDLITSGTIGVTLLDAEGNDYDGKSQYRNIKYTTDDGTSWTPGTTAYLTSTEGKAVAYYPFVDGAVDPTSIPVDATKQQDVMYSKWVEGLSNLNSRAEFHMEHALAAVRVIVKKDANFSSDVTLTDVTIQSDGFYESAKLDATTGDLKDLQTEGASFSVTAIDKLLDTGGQTVDFTVIPGAAAKDISFMVTAGGNRYHSSFTPDGPLARGFIHTFTLVLTAEEAVLDGVSVTPWQELKQDPDYMDFYDEYYQNGIICTYYTTTEGSLNVAYSVSGISKMMVDGVEVTPATSVNVAAGEHVVKYLFNDNKMSASNFYNCTALKTVYVSKNLKNISNGAFNGCSNITSYDFSNATGLVTIEDYAFQNNTNLKSIDLSKAVNLTQLGSTYVDYRKYNDFTDYSGYVLGKCSSLESVVLPESLLQINNFAFYNCSNLKSINIPSSVNKIGMRAFYLCKKLESIDLSECNSLTLLADGLFGESGLKDVKLPVSLTAIRDKVFNKCPFESLDLSYLINLTTIGYTFHPGYLYESESSWYVVGAFSQCTELENIKLPEGLKTINGGTFEECTKLSNLQIPVSVTTLGVGVFMDTESLYSLDLSKHTISSDCQRLFESSNIKYFKFPKGMQKVPARMFASCLDLTEIDIPNTVTTIDFDAFRDCIKLADLNIPNSVVTIGRNAFANCEGLSGELEIPNSVETIKDYAFDRCKNITSIKIGSGLKSIGTQAFYPYKVENIVVDANNATYNSNNNCNAIINTSTNSLVVGCNNTIIPDNCTSIGSYAFYYCCNIRSIEIPASVTSISKYAFYGTDIVFIRFRGSNAPTIDSSSLSTSNGYYIIPDGASSSYSSVISYLNGKNFKYSEESQCSIENEVVYSADGKSLLATTGKANGIITIKEGVETFCSYAIYKANNITELILPNSLVTIENYAATYCPNLKSITIGSGVKTIGSRFVDSSGVNKITSLAPVAPSISNNTFIYCAQQGHLYILQGATGYAVWLGTGSYYLNYCTDKNWQIVEF